MANDKISPPEGNKEDLTGEQREYIFHTNELLTSLKAQRPDIVNNTTTIVLAILATIAAAAVEKPLFSLSIAAIVVIFIVYIFKIMKPKTEEIDKKINDLSEKKKNFIDFINKDNDSIKKNDDPYEKLKACIIEYNFTPKTK